jgi:hypothetical protein
LGPGYLTGPDEKPSIKIKDEKNSDMLAVPSDPLRYIPEKELDQFLRRCRRQKALRITIMFQR